MYRTTDTPKIEYVGQMVLYGTFVVSNAILSSHSLMDLHEL